VTAPDTSVLVAGYLRNHVFHQQAAGALAEVVRSGRLLGHTLAETYAVLTAGGGPYEVPADSVLLYLERFLAREPVWLGGSGYREALTTLAAAGVEGGAVWDGLIGLAAREAGTQLVSLDRRAATTYERIGLDFRLLA
jgi:predicted nucleic acid-binding protein